MKHCNGCDLTKPLEEFHRDKRQPDGRTSRCAKCRTAKENKRYQDNPEPYRQYRRDRQVTHKDIIAVRDAAAYQRNRDNIIPGACAAVARRRHGLVMTPREIKKSVEYRKKIRDNECYYCHEIKPEMQWDHYYPLSLGGTDHWFNLVRACLPCNQRKKNKLASEFIASM